jgi:hypothetical protein
MGLDLQAQGWASTVVVSHGPDDTRMTEFCAPHIQSCCVCSRSGYHQRRSTRTASSGEPIRVEDGHRRHVSATHFSCPLHPGEVLRRCADHGRESGTHTPKPMGVRVRVPNRGLPTRGAATRLLTRRRRLRLYDGPRRATGRQRLSNSRENVGVSAVVQRHPLGSRGCRLVDALHQRRRPAYTRPLFAIHN